MRYITGSDFRRALETRLRTQSQRDGVPLVRLRKLVAFDRLLARLLLAEPDAWILKGGLALQLRLGQRARTTKDIGFLLRQPVDDLHQLLVHGLSLDAGDWFRFEVDRPRSQERELPGGGKRFFAQSLLDGRDFETFHLDVGMGDPMIGNAQYLAMPALLEFADIAPTIVPCYPITQQLAEKTHAYCSTHGTGANSRVKDLIDILLLASLQPLSGLILSQALRVTFAARGIDALPLTLPDAPGNWAQPFRRLADETGLTWRELDNAVEAARRFVDPVLQGIGAADWNPTAWTWQ